ncbi:response regulator transcription factor [Planctomycetota bacterium]
MSTARILVVDDDTDILASIKRILKRSKYEVFTAESGKVGLRMAMENPPDLILLDVTMPVMSGHEFLRRFRRLEDRFNSKFTDKLGTSWNPEIPVIFLTGRTKPHQQIDGLDAGAVDYVKKSVSPNELRARIRCHLRRVQTQKKILEPITSKLQKLESAVSEMQDTAHSCQKLLLEINSYIDLIESVNKAVSDNSMQMQTKKKIQHLMQSLIQITGWPITKT